MICRTGSCSNCKSKPRQSRGSEDPRELESPTDDPDSAAQKAGLGVQTHCYIHPERRSVAVCVVCRRGICRLCHEVQRGRDFCTADAELLRRSESSAEKAKYVRKKTQPVSAQMGCHIHPNRRAVDVCSVCKRGVCSSCLVVFKGRSFCKSDAEILRRKELHPVSAQPRKTAIGAAAFIAVVDGAAGAIVGFVLIILGLIGPQAQNFDSLSSELQPFFSYFANVLNSNFPASQTLEIGLIAFMLGMGDMMAGMLLVKRSRIAGMATIVISIMWGVLVGSYFVILALAGILTYVGIAFAFAKIGLVVYAWRYLDER